MMAAPEFLIRLYRDTFSTPWGFRLQGGVDFKTPLTIQRVFVGSPADTELHRGDIIIAIENQPAAGMTHQAAQDLIKSAGGSLTLTVQRGCRPPSQTIRTFPAPQVRVRTCVPVRINFEYASPRPSPRAPTSPTSPSKVKEFAIDYRNRVQQKSPAMDPATYPHISTHHTNLGHRPHQWHPPESSEASLEFATDYGQLAREHGHQVPVQHSLGQAAYRFPGMEVDPEPYEQRSVGDLKKRFSAGQHDRHPGIQRTGRRWQRGGDEIGSTGMMTFGWTPTKQPTEQPATRSYVPLRAPGQGPVPVPVNQAPQESYSPSPAPTYETPQSDSYAYEPSRPAWLGSLKSEARGPVTKPWENDPVVEEQQANAPPSVVHKPRVQTVHYAPGQSPQYVADAPQEDSSPTARVVHLQYNSPLGLYSTGNVQETLEGQVRGRPGEGTMTVTGPAKEFDPNKSAVLKMLNQQNKPHPRRRIYQEEPTPPLDLQPPGSQEQSYGTSDF